VNAARISLMRRRMPEAARWTICFALALCFHGAGAAAMLAHWNEDADLMAGTPVVTVDLSPMAVAPRATPNELPPGPQQTEAQPEPQPEKPLEKVELPPDPKAEPLVAVQPPKPIEKPKEKKLKREHRADLTSAPTPADTPSERAAAPAFGRSSGNAVPNWKSMLVAQLERNKRYPSDAQSRGEQGVAQLAFSVDRSGRVHNARISRSSGSSTLDAATLAMVERAQPLPPPPPEMSGAQIAIVVPIRYNIR
jgi:protein TonB